MIAYGWNLPGGETRKRKVLNQLGQTVRNMAYVAIVRTPSNRTFARPISLRTKRARTTSDGGDCGGR